MLSKKEISNLHKRLNAAEQRAKDYAGELAGANAQIRRLTHELTEAFDEVFKVRSERDSLQITVRQLSKMLTAEMNLNAQRPLVAGADNCLTPGKLPFAA